MRVAVPTETSVGERRSALVPAGVKQLKGLGLTVAIEAGLGSRIGIADADYAAAGAEVVGDRAALLRDAAIVLRVRKPPASEVDLLARDALHVSFLDPFNERGLVERLAQAGVTAISMEMMPRSTRAQKMDALSSQASLGGYVAVILAARHLPKIFPMMMTPAGTISPARVFVIGAGVAGLQAIATAKRLGARVDAFDTRSVVAEQVQSLGARFVTIDVGGETGQTAQGYARELTAEQIARQQAGMKEVVAGADVVITTAQVFGRPAPRIVTRDMVAAMRPSSVIVDMAVETGGNVDGSVLNEVAEVSGVRIVGLGNLPGEVARNASEMYSSNLVALLGEFFDKARKGVVLPEDDDIARSAVVTRGGAIVNETIKARYAA
jgi:NAD(P) transhydrogenase subunit alpha